MCDISLERTFHYLIIACADWITKTARTDVYVTLPINSGQQQDPSLCTDTSRVTAIHQDKRAINALTHHRYDTYMYSSLKMIIKYFFDLKIKF